VRRRKQGAGSRKKIVKEGVGGISMLPGRGPSLLPFELEKLFPD